MASIEFGLEPVEILVYLTRHSDFVQVLEGTDADGELEDWADTEEVTLAFSSGDSWLGTLDGPRVSWNVDKVDVETVIDHEPRSVELLYRDTDSELDLVWASGPVQIQ